jgi:peptidoglycan/xylan/chitin deacetylase (PgdA/CDA1 family)
VPTGAVGMQIFHVLENVGYLDLDDVSLTRSETLPPPPPPASTGFRRPLVSLTIDDANISDATVVFPTLRENGLVGTFYLPSGYINTSEHISGDQAKQLSDAGMEIGGHTINHVHLPEVSDDELRRQLTESKSSLERIIQRPVTSFASPFGEYNERTVNGIRSSYRSHRTTDTGFNAKNDTNALQLRRQNITPNVTVADVEGWLRQAQAEGSWLILVVHDVQDNPGDYGTTPDRFRQIVAAIRKSAATVKTVTGALDEVEPQLTKS